MIGARIKNDKDPHYITRLTRYRFSTNNAPQKEQEVHIETSLILPAHHSKYSVTRKLCASMATLCDCMRIRDLATIPMVSASTLITKASQASYRLQLAQLTCFLYHLIAYQGQYESRFFSNI